MNKTEIAEARARFRTLWNSPAIRKSCGLDREPPDPNDGDTSPEFNPKMPSLERIDAVIKVCRGAL